jgi:hypothetical protein
VLGLIPFDEAAHVGAGCRSHDSRAILVSIGGYALSIEVENLPLSASHARSGHDIDRVGKRRQASTAQPDMPGITAF